MEKSARDARPEALAEPGVQQHHPGSIGKDTQVGLALRTEIMSLCIKRSL